MFKNYPDPTEDWIFALQDGTKIVLTDPELSYDFVYNPIDDTVKSKSEDGYVTTRPRNTRILYTYNLNFNYLKKVDSDTLKINLWEQVKATEWFYWKYPFKDNDQFVIKNVRFMNDSLPEFNHEWWDRVTVSFKLEDL